MAIEIVVVTRPLHVLTAGRMGGAALEKQMPPAIVVTLQWTGRLLSTGLAISDALDSALAMRPTRWVV